MTGAWVFALAALLIGMVLARAGRSMRRRRGLTQGTTLDLDRRTLYSARHRLAGRPDRTVSDGAMAIPEEWKPSAQRVYDSHLAQLATYFILIEEDTGVRPTHGYLGVGDGLPPHRIENTPELQAWVLGIADDIRAARRDPNRPIPVRQSPGKCRACGVRPHCPQRSA